MNLQKEFNRLKEAYDENEFEKILNNKLGIYFLKLRSLSRNSILKELAQKLNVEITTVNNNKLFEFIFCLGVDELMLDEFIRQKYSEERDQRKSNEELLYSQLYKLKVFDWGGFYQNAVEQTIVNTYIKKVQNFEKLCDLVENEINPRLKGYILCSWYNHWTSILIEDMFKDHPALMPTVGLVKKVDFFWKDFPFDLKVTYFPQGFMELKRKEKGLNTELTELKRFSREHSIFFDEEASDKEMFFELLARISEDTSSQARKFIKEFRKRREEIILESLREPKQLIKWLYENQGVRRFDAASKFFLILINLKHLEDSWKLKRNKRLLEKSITNYINNNKNIDKDEFKVSFKWQGKIYTTYATALFVLVR